MVSLSGTTLIFVIWSVKSVHTISVINVQLKVSVNNPIGIEANDVGALLEQFLEYEEKQGKLAHAHLF